MRIKRATSQLANAGTGESVSALFGHETLSGPQEAIADTSPCRSGGSVEMMFHDISAGAVNDQGSEVTGEHRENYDVLAQLALADPLTGLANRLLLLDRLTQALTRVERHGGHVIVVHIDLDNLRDINDEFGYTAGNAVLCEVSRRLTTELRTEDTLSRVGGNELVALISIGNTQAVGSLRQRLQEVFDDPIVTAGRAVRISARFGFVTAENAESAEGVLTRADRATYVEKFANQLMCS